MFLNWNQFFLVRSWMLSVKDLSMVIIFLKLFWLQYTHIQNLAKTLLALLGGRVKTTTPTIESERNGKCKKYESSIHDSHRFLQTSWSLEDTPVLAVNGPHCQIVRSIQICHYIKANYTYLKQEWHGKL